ncbi:glycerophosphodiester phosphodiesterase [Acidianus sulfidivorans JP7]|uniref:Glycerophosphodiester phosphodiesterase n=1 Tax=Acidianus sulfidivorans JP7 TaxID=619593 RepID=A0A2U9IJG9_9CREN|nr:glycerophosphodiester phosphodiesterase family protein [Acidianus sulfidivorans]AWR96125.1 glycerophosphodiester phosphodiesterase [Acidianus sulfidivorans JP7]
MRPLLFGHRGSRGLSPENTIPSFKIAKCFGVDGVELDVHLSKDRKLVVIHDETVDRTTNGKGKVSELTYDEISRLDAGIKLGQQWKGTNVPLLRDVLETFGDSLLYKIEIKHSSKVYPDIERLLLEEIERFSLRNKVQIISFDFDALEKVRELDKNVEIGLIIVGKPRWFIDTAKKLNAKWIHASSWLITSEDVKIVHDSDLKIGVWTVNDEEEMKTYCEMGVDDVTSDFPNQLVRLCEND